MALEVQIVQFRVRQQVLQKLVGRVGVAGQVAPELRMALEQGEEAHEGQDCLIARPGQHQVGLDEAEEAGPATRLTGKEVLALEGGVPQRRHVPQNLRWGHGS